MLQETYIRAFTHLSEFRSEARLSTWLTRIALNEALGRRRQLRPTTGIKALEAMAAPSSAYQPGPERAAALADIRRLLERAISGLPEHYRIVFVMRDVEEMSIEETALLLGLQPETVSTRLHRARKLLREALQEKVAGVFTDTLLFGGARCDRSYASGPRSARHPPLIEASPAPSQSQLFPGMPRQISAVREYFGGSKHLMSSRTTLPGVHSITGEP